MKRKAPRKPRKSRASQKPAQRGRKVAKTAAADRFDPMIAVAARALDLTIDPAWQPEIRSHLQVILRHGARVAEFALPDEAEPAPVFKA